MSNTDTNTPTPAPKWSAIHPQQTRYRLIPAGWFTFADGRTVWVDAGYVAETAAR